MPYEIIRVGTYYTVRNKDTGKKFSEHSTENSAKAQLRLLENADKGNTKLPISSTVKYKGRRFR